MLTEIDDAEAYRPLLESTIRANASRLAQLLIVHDIAEWAAIRNGNCQTNPIAMAVTDGETGAWGILLRRSIDQSQISSVLDRIEFGGFHSVREILSSSEAFLSHTVLHELAHLENTWGQDREESCDEWAFSRLGLHAP